MIVLQLDSIQKQLDAPTTAKADVQDAPFVAHTLTFSDASLCIVLSDEKRVKKVSFQWIACCFFEVHTDASWNIMPSVNNEGLYMRRYLIEKKIKGSSNEVLLGVDLRLNKRVALKTVAHIPDYQREIALCTALTKAGSECVVRLFDHWVEENGPGHMVFECGNATLWDRTYQDHGMLPPEELDLLVQGLSRGLQELHAVGFIHTDLKPRNVLQCGKCWKLIDLDSGCKIGEPMQLQLTPSYCPPEMAKKRKSGDELIAIEGFDMWSYGVILLECISGQRWFNECETCEANLEWLAGKEAAIERTIQRRLMLLRNTQEVYIEIVRRTVMVDARERASATACMQALEESGCLRTTDSSPSELRGFPLTVPEDVKPVVLSEHEFSGDATVFNTTATACSAISAAANDRAELLIFADFDTYLKTATLRAYSLRMQYHGRLPTNNYDDSELNWNCAAREAQPKAGNTKDEEKDKAPSPKGYANRAKLLEDRDKDVPNERNDVDEGKDDDEDARASEPVWMRKSPADLLKQYSWRELQKKMDARCKSSAARHRKAADVESLSRGISPFFTEWKRSGAVYQPVPAFYSKGAEHITRLPKVSRTRKKKRDTTIAKKEPGRDLDFIRSFPKTLNADPVASDPQPARERCYCGKSAVGQHVKDVLSSMHMKIVRRGGGVVDTALWAQPPRKTLGLINGSNPRWLSDMDALLGIAAPAQCPAGHLVKEHQVQVKEVACTSCRVRFPCCTKMFDCSVCATIVCTKCLEKSRKKDTKEAKQGVTKAVGSLTNTK